MFVEMRTYTFKPGEVANFLSLYENSVMALQKRILGEMVGYFTTEIGALNQVIHLWRYESLEERIRRRGELMSHPEWQQFLTKLMPILVAQDSKLLLPTKFSPIQ